MKKLTTILGLSVVILASSFSLAFASADSVGPITINAEIPGVFDLKVAMHKNTSTGGTVTVMNFGTLVQDPTFFDYRSSTSGSTGTGSVVALTSCQSTVGKYQITQTGTTLTKGSDTMPAGAQVVVPVYSPADNGGAAFVGTMGTKGSWVGTRTLYTSDAIGSERVCQNIYSITSDPAAGATAAVPSSQPAGVYAATVTLNAVTI